MSKLFKELNYDTDRVMQPGDPLTSPDGKTVVSANNNGTATLNTTVQGYDTSVNGITDITAAQQAEIDQLAVTAYTGSFVTLRRDPNNDPGPTGGARYWVNFSQDGTDISSNNDMASAELYSDGTIRVYDGMPDLLSIFNASSENPAVIGHAPTSQTTVTKTIATEDQLPDMTPVAAKSAVNTAISTINTNFTNLHNFLSSWAETVQASVGSIASGWSFSPDNSTWNNKVRFFHWGRIVYIYGFARKSSLLSANTRSASIGTIAWPSGYTMMSAGGNIADERVTMSISSAGTINLVNIQQISANTSISIRAILPASIALTINTVATI